MTDNQMQQKPELEDIRLVGNTMSTAKMEPLDPNVEAKNRRELIAKVMLLGSLDSPRNGRIPAGYTYLGQMISHDIIAATDGSLTLSSDQPVSAELNLESLYGDEKFLQSGGNVNESGKFKLGKAKGGRRIGQDIRRELVNGKGFAKIPESRNDENVIISQLHLFWLRFHNKVIDRYFSDLPSRLKKYNAGRAFVTQVFYHIVIDDFLCHLLEPLVYQKICIDDKTFLYSDLTFTGIPVEFSHAGYRFGHSMVREEYKLQKGGGDKKLSQLFIRDHGEHIAKELVVKDWLLFFGSSALGHKVQDSGRIDLKIVDPMKRVPKDDRTGSQNLIEANLIAGDSKKIPSGWEVVKWLRTHHHDLAEAVEMATDEQYPKPDYYGTILDGLGGILLIEELPLWPYLLIEDSETNVNGLCLGKLGSVLMAEVVMQSIKSAKRSAGRLDSGVQIKLDEFYALRSCLRMLDIIEFMKKAG
jgi:hypothetical protein